MRPSDTISRYLRYAERLQGWLVDRRSNRETIVGLKSRQRRAGLRSENSISRSGVITPRLVRRIARL